MREYLINGKMFRLNIFNKIETKEQAYLIGYLCGDGGFQKPTHKRKARLFVSSNDKFIIEQLQRIFCPDATISSKVPVNNTKGYNIKTENLSYMFNFSSRFEECFNKFGILSTKSDRKLVNISKKNMRYYLLGLFDADGHISFGHRKDRNRLWANFGITHQSFDVLSKVQDFLMTDLGVASSVRQRSDENCMDLKFSKIDSVLKVLDWLYADPPVVYSQTKYKRYLKLKELAL